MPMTITANITSISYSPTLCSDLHEYPLSDLETALTSSSFLLSVPNQSTWAVSRWVSPKRTRSYPYANVYDTIKYLPRLTIIPVVKDEGIDGDRDFLQWDTISLMSLLNVFTIITYYDKAEINDRVPSKKKITNQKFNIEHIKSQILRLNSYVSSALHWNVDQLNSIGDIGDRALSAYKKIEADTKIPLHSPVSAKKHFYDISQSSSNFISISRSRAEISAKSEQQTIHDLEKLSGQKSLLVIKNYLGGEYYLTVDEVHFLPDNTIQLVEAKNTTDPSKFFTSMLDIKDAIFKMILLTNLKNVFVDGVEFKHESIVKLTSTKKFDIINLSVNKQDIYNKLLIEGKVNNFSLAIE
jgi:hypothetical protein